MTEYKREVLGTLRPNYADLAYQIVKVKPEAADKINSAPLGSRLVLEVPLEGEEYIRVNEITTISGLYALCGLPRHRFRPQDEVK